MADTLNTIRNRHKTATVPIPGAMWDGMPPPVQLAMLQMEAAKFAAAMHKQDWGGFQVAIVRDNSDEMEIVLSVGAPEEKNSGLIVPERSLIMPN